jgi:hypothetical protein
MSSVERSIEDASLNGFHKTLAFSTSLSIAPSLLAEFLPRTTRSPLSASRVVSGFVVGCLAATCVINVLLVGAISLLSALASWWLAPETAKLDLQQASALEACAPAR